jgi:hypothetical protein
MALTTQTKSLWAFITCSRVKFTFTFTTSYSVHFKSMVFWGFDDIYSLLQNVKSHVYSGMIGTWNVVSLKVSYDRKHFFRHTFENTFVP